MVSARDWASRAREQREPTRERHGRFGCCLLLWLATRTRAVKLVGRRDAHERMRCGLVLEQRSLDC